MMDLSYAMDINDMFMKAIASGRSKDIEYALEYTALIKMEDTGGQPEFMDMLPALVLGPSLHLIFCKLTDELKSRYTVSFLNPSGESTPPMESSYTVEEVILQSLSSVSCSRSLPDTSSASQEGGGKNPLLNDLDTSAKSVAFIVGTHKDLVTEKQIEKFDSDLKEVINNTSFYEEGLVGNATKGRLVVAVDNQNGGAEEVEALRLFLENRIRHHFKKIPIPCSWLIFSLCLRRRIQRLSTLNSCYRLARQLGMAPWETKLALWFFHHYAGILMYFPDIPELENMVISDVQIIFGSVTNMIVHTFQFGNTTDAAQEWFRKTGQFLLKDVKEALHHQQKNEDLVTFVAWKDIMVALVKYHDIWTAGPSDSSQDIKEFEVEDLQRALSEVANDHIPIDQLVIVLEHLHIIVPIKQSTPSPSRSRSGQSSNVFYFMPCILQNASEEELLKFFESEPLPLVPAPLMIRYECGYVPLGVFPALTANLVGHDQLDLIVKGIRKNRIQFRFGSDFDTVTLISRPKFYQVCIRRVPGAITPIHIVCGVIREIVEEALETVTSRMNCALSVSYQFSFECPSHPCKDHLCVVKKDNASPRFMCCIEDSDDPQPLKMERQHLVWFNKVR